MPTSTKTREKSNTYKSHNLSYSRAMSDRRLYANTSSAYEIPTAYPERKDRPVDSRNVNGRKRKTASFSLNRPAFAVFMFVATLVVLCCCVIYRQTVILESNQEIKKLEKEYAAILATNQAMQAEIDMWLEMGEVERYAREELGMIKPETSQIFYIDMKMEDMSGKGSVSESAANAAYGIQGSLVNAFRVLK